jgi:hypothetical protein
VLVRPAGMAANTHRVIGRHHVTHSSANLTLTNLRPKNDLGTIEASIEGAEYAAPDITESHPLRHGT